MDSVDRCMAIQKIISARNLAHQDSDPCWVLEGLYIGETLHHIGCCWHIMHLPKQCALPFRS